MIAIPAVDLREGKCVQLVGGDYDAERIRLDDPVTVARGWVRKGFRRLHIVDLDAATGRGSNAVIVDEILRESAIPVQVGGGVRDEARIAHLLDRGAAFVVVGTRAVEDPEWLSLMASRFPRRLVVAADVRDCEIVLRGWTEASRRNVFDFTAALTTAPLAGILVTAVQQEGRMQGPDAWLMENIVRLTRHAVIASGGVASLEDLRRLAHIGVGAAVLGMALYTGALEVPSLVAEFGS
jgi:phosphoribosylformimino-5-aminoimidazole carboxamide ribotide isomerase